MFQLTNTIAQSKTYKESFTPNPEVMQDKDIIYAEKTTRFTFLITELINCSGQTATYKNFLTNQEYLSLEKKTNQYFDTNSPQFIFLRTVFLANQSGRGALNYVEIAKSMSLSLQDVKNYVALYLCHLQLCELTTNFKHLNVYVYTKEEYKKIMATTLQKIETLTNTFPNSEILYKMALDKESQTRTHTTSSLFPSQIDTKTTSSTIEKPESIETLADNGEKKEPLFGQSMENSFQAVLVYGNTFNLFCSPRNKNSLSAAIRQKTVNYGATTSEPISIVRAGLRDQKERAYYEK